MGRYCTVATCQLDQWALDFKGNYQRIVESIRQAKRAGAKYRLGPELEVCGYSCEDHFFEEDTLAHCWEVMEEILKSDLTDNILCDIGMPVMHDNVRYNCRVFCINRQVVMIRPKMHLADEGAYREGRWFTAWARGYVLQDHTLPRRIREITGQSVCKFGVGAIQLADTSLASETCEELFTPNNPGITLGLGGVEILGNGSGSCHTLGKLSRRVDLITEQTKKNGGVYLYANHQGCDGGRMYFDGSAMVVLNGGMVAQGSQFSLRDVEVTLATIDLDDVQGYRASIASRGVQASTSTVIPKVPVDFYLCEHKDMVETTEAMPPRFHTEEEEIAYGPACWLWDALRRTRTQGFVLPLSGGADSACVAAIVFIMCDLVFKYIENRKNELPGGEGDRTLVALRDVIQDPDYIPESAQDICKRILFCCHFKWAGSQPGACDRAKGLAGDIGCSFDVYDIEPMLNCAHKCTEAKEKNLSEIEKEEFENAKTNMRNRVRMSMTYYHGQVALVGQRPKAAVAGTLLTLSSLNADAALRGFFTKYDQSSGDLSPIGSLSKYWLRKFIVWAGHHKEMPTLLVIAAKREGTTMSNEHQGHVTKEILQEIALPSTTAGHPAPGAEGDDDPGLGVRHEEISAFGKLRKDDRCGPVSLFHKLLRRSGHVEKKNQAASDNSEDILDAYAEQSPQEIADQVKRFFVHYAAHRHKMTTLTPSYFLESHASDDNRYDPRQFIYDCAWSWQFHQIDRMVAEDEEAQMMGRKRVRDQATAGPAASRVSGFGGNDPSRPSQRRRLDDGVTFGAPSPKSSSSVKKGGGSSSSHGLFPSAPAKF